MTEPPNSKSAHSDDQPPARTDGPPNQTKDSSKRDRNGTSESGSGTRGLPEYHDSWYRNGTIREEVRQTVENQVSWLERINEKALGLLRFNVTLLGLLVPILSFAMEFGVVTEIARFYTLHTVLGVVTLVASTAGAGLTYSSSSMNAGVSDSDIETAKRRGLTDIEVHDTLIESYGDWIQSNRRTLRRNATLVTFTVGLTLSAIVLLSLGFTSALFDGLPTYVEFTTYTGLVLLLACLQYF